jgi:hypothetical protein
MPLESRPSTPLPGSIRLLREEANLLAKPVVAACKKLCTLEDWLVRAEVSFVESTVSVPSLFRLTPISARLPMPLLPEMEAVSAESRVDCASRTEPSASSGPPPEPSELTVNCTLMSLMTV